MALTFPLVLADFADFLHYDSAQLDLRRGEERSGSGDGRFWSAELHRPLWTAEVPLAQCRAELARSVNAKVRALDGSNRQFLFCDPGYDGPAGGTVGLGGVTITAISPDRDRVALGSLPGNFALAAGDMFSVTYGGGRYYMGEFSEAATSTFGGVILNLEVRPYLPLGIAVGAAVRLVRPVFKAVVEAFTPYTILKDGSASGASITLIQKP